MNDSVTVVRWRRRGDKGRKGNNRFVRWHRPVDIPADREGRTACGIRYPRSTAEYGGAGDGVLCKNCIRAMSGDVPGEAAA